MLKVALSMSRCHCNFDNMHENDCFSPDNKVTMIQCFQRNPSNINLSIHPNTHPQHLHTNTKVAVFSF